MQKVFQAEETANPKYLSTRKRPAGAGALKGRVMRRREGGKDQRMKLRSLDMSELATFGTSPRGLK